MRVEESIEFTCRKIFNTLSKVVAKRKFDHILFSGGVDTSIIAYLASKWRPTAITVSFEGKGLDLEYARRVTEYLGLNHIVYEYTLKEALNAVREVIRILRVFDPMEVRNSVSIYVGMKVSEQRGARIIATGDGGDELFGGYPWLFNLSPAALHKSIIQMVNTWRFSAKDIGGDVGLEVFQPFTEKEIVELAIKIPPQLKVVEVNGRKIGKWILRKAFENSLPKEVIWREKAPIEIGSGSTFLATEVSKLISDKEFKDLNELVRLRSREQAYYLKVFLEIFGSLPKNDGEERKCPYCGVSIASNTRFCRMCGAYPL